MAEDRFDDVRMKNTGIFGDDTPGIENGLAAFDGTSTVPMPDGVHVEMHCRNCGRPVRISCEWGEMIAVRYNVPPHVAFHGTQFVKDIVEWFFSKEQESWCPRKMCRNCNNLCAPGFKPEEAEKHLSVARRNGWVQPNAEAAASQRCAQVAQRMDAKRR